MQDSGRALVWHVQGPGFHTQHCKNKKQETKPISKKPSLGNQRKIFNFLQLFIYDPNFLKVASRIQHAYLSSSCSTDSWKSNKVRQYYKTELHAGSWSHLELK
jgi:hypothetical protein